MTTATANPSTGLAIDPAVPQRDLLLDPEGVADLLTRISPPGTTIESCSLRRVKYRVGESLRVVYDVAVDGRRVLMSARTFGDSAGIFRKAGSVAQDVLGMPGVAHDPRTGTVWWTLPNDRKLRNLGALLEPSARVRGNCGVAWRRSELVEYAPEKSATVRVLDPRDQVSGFAKVYLDREALDVTEQYNRIAAAVAPLDGVRTPRVVGSSRPDRIVVLEPMRGRTWTQMPAEVQPVAMRQLGAALANIHGLPSDLGQGPFQRYRQERVLNSADLVAVARPDVADAVRALRGRLAGAPRPLGETVCLHGDVHANNVLFDGDMVHMIDLDQGGAGDAAADIGSVLATLLTAQLLRPDTAVDGLGRAVLDGYGAVRAIPDDGRLRWYTAAALMVERAIRAVNRVNGPVLAVLPELIDAADALLTGRRRADG